jgi:hypothetical protein
VARWQVESEKVAKINFDDGSVALWLQPSCHHAIMMVIGIRPMSRLGQRVLSLIIFG